MKPYHSFLLIVALAAALRAADESSGPPAPTAPETAAQSKTRSAAPKQTGPEKWIGVAIARVPEMLRAQLPNLPEGQGVLVFKVIKDSPAMAAGLERFDVIVRADGQPLGTLQDLIQILNKRNLGTQARLELIRKGASKQLYVIVLEKPEGKLRNDDPNSGVIFEGIEPEKVSIQFSYTDADGKPQTIGERTLAAFGQKMEQGGELYNQMQQMFQDLRQNPQGITIQLRPVQDAPVRPPANP